MKSPSEQLSDIDTQQQKLDQKKAKFRKNYPELFSIRGSRFPNLVTMFCSLGFVIILVIILFFS